MKLSYGAPLILLLLCLPVILPSAEFIPFTHKDKSNTETHTGLWFCPQHGGAADVAAMKTMLMPTTESVTGGVALKMIMEPGAKGILTREQGSFPPSAGITLYAKASRDLNIQIAKGTARVGTEWGKINLTWAALGTTPEKRKLGWQWTLKVTSPINEKTWLIIDRLGVEHPTFIDQPKITINNAADVLLSSKDIIYHPEHIKETVENISTKPITLLVLGDSVTAGAQAARGNWNVKNIKPYLYFNVLASTLNKQLGAKIVVKDFGHGGWTAEKALGVVDKEIVANAKAGDLVILEFGANDLNWANVPHATYKENMRKLIKRVKTKTDQIILMGPTMFNGLEKQADDVARILKELCVEEKVAALDITKMFVHQGPAFGWAWLANSCHPDFCGHAVIGRMMVPLFTGKHINYPFK